MNCLFCKMVEGDIPVDKVFEDDDLLAFRDINPTAPVHILIIPKKHLGTLNDASEADQAMLGRIMLVARQIADDEGIAESGYRIAMNNNREGGQAIYHMHMHLLGGRQMGWPAG